VSFENPRLLAALFLLLPLALGMIFHYLRRRRVLELFPDPVELRRRYGISSLFFLVFVACLIIALAGPHWGTRLVPEFRRGADVVLAIDLSRSMEAQIGRAHV
jgi:Ca-activated chloride channel family protein